MRHVVSRAIWLALLVAPQACAALLGRVEAGVYIAPGQHFEVRVPTMRNPFVKAPSSVTDARRPDGSVDVTFAVRDLGEAWRFGVMPAASMMPAEASSAAAASSPTAAPSPEALARVADRLLQAWLPAPAPPGARVLVQEADWGGSPGLLHVYDQPGAALLQRAGTAPDAAHGLVGVFVAAHGDGRSVRYLVGQFDMDLHKLRFMIEDVRMSREKAVERFALDHAQRLRALAPLLALR